MKKKLGGSVIPETEQVLLSSKVKDFNSKKLSKANYKYAIRVKGKFIYLDLDYGDDRCDKIGRLTYNGNIKDMYFAIYKYSSERYDPDEFCFPGTKYLNGTIEGAMKAGLKAYT